MRVALDTNVLVSAFGTRGLCADVLQVVLAEHELIVGATVLKELGRVLRAKFQLPPSTVTDVQVYLRRQAVVVDADASVRLDIRDPADLVIMAEALAGRAEVLITGDRDLLAVAQYSPVAILTPREFWQRLRSTR